MGVSEPPGRIRLIDAGVGADAAGAAADVPACVDRLAVLVAAPGVRRTLRSGIFAVLLNAFVASAAGTMFGRLGWGRGVVSTAICTAGVAMVTLPFLWRWLARTFTSAAVLVEPDGVAVRRRWRVGRFALPARTRRTGRSDADHAYALRHGRWYLPGGHFHTLHLTAGHGRRRTILPVAAFLRRDEERWLIDALNARLLPPDPPAWLRATTYAPEVQEVLDAAVFEGNGLPVVPLPPDRLSPRSRVRVRFEPVRTGRGISDAADEAVGERVVVRVPGFERWGDRLATGLVLIGAATLGTFLMTLVLLAGLLGNVPLWFQLGVATLPAAACTVVPLVWGVWSVFGRVTTTVGPPDPPPFDPFDPPADADAAGSPPAVVSARWHVGPFGVTYAAPADEVIAVAMGRNIIRDGHLQSGLGEPRQAVAFTPYQLIPLTSSYLKDRTRVEAAGVVKWAIERCRTS